MTTATNTSQFSGSSIFNVGLIAILLGLGIALWVGAWPFQSSESAPAAVSHPIAQAVEAERTCEGEQCTTQAAIDAQAALLAMPEKIMYDDGLQCAYVDDVGKDFCTGFLKTIKARRASGYYQNGTNDD